EAAEVCKNEWPRRQNLNVQTIRICQFLVAGWVRDAAILDGVGYPLRRWWSSGAPKSARRKGVRFPASRREFVTARPVRASTTGRERSHRTSGALDRQDHGAGR